MDAPDNTEHNGVIRLYHQFPYFYNSFKEMTDQLPHLKYNLLCNTVWVGPLQECGRKKVRRNQKVVSGGMYGMRDHQKFNDRLKFNSPVDEIKAYTKKCRELKITPIFDLVINQVAADDDSPIIGLLGRKNFSEGAWDDCLFFDYEKEDFKKNVIENFWKPFIKTYIIEYGFRGVRIDAVKHIAKKFPGVLREVCNYIIEILKNVCFEENVKPVILAELLDENPTKYVKFLKGFGFTHILNSTFESTYSKDARIKNKSYGGWNNNDWLLREIGNLQTTIYDTPDKENSLNLGGTIGYVGNHDKQSLGCAVKNIISSNYSTSKDEVECAKEFIFGVSFVSDAGWYLLAGDEYYPKSKDKHKNITFSSNCEPLNWIDISNENLCRFIGSVNYVLSNFTSTAFPYWVELGNGSSQEYNIGIAFRHVGKSEKQKDELICINLSKNTCDLNLLQKEAENYLQGKNTDKLRHIYIIDNGIVKIFYPGFLEKKLWIWDERDGNNTLLFGYKEGNKNQTVKIFS